MMANCHFAAPTGKPENLETPKTPELKWEQEQGCLRKERPLLEQPTCAAALPLPTMPEHPVGPGDAAGALRI